MDETVFIKGPDFDVDLSFLDSYIFNLYSYRILCFRLNDSSSYASMITTLKKGLQRLVDRAPILGGIIEPAADDPTKNRQRGWKLAKPGPGIELTVKDLTKSMDYEELERKNFPVAELKSEQLIPATLDFTRESGVAFKIQLSCIEGGALISICINHPVADGNGMNEIMRTLANECRAVQLNLEEDHGSLPEKLGMDRSAAIALSALTSSKTKQEDHPGYLFLPDPSLAAPDPSSSSDGGEKASGEDHAHAPGPKLRCHMFQISPSNLSELKQAATGTIPVSTHDAICALTWRSIMLSRHRAGTVPDLDIDTTWSMPTDARRHVGIEKAWIGNMVYFQTCTMPLRTLLQPTSLPTAAALIRKDLLRIDTDTVLGLWNIAAKLPHTGMLLWGIIPAYQTTSIGAATSWKADAMYGSDWGGVFGEVKRFRSPDTGFLASLEGVPFVLPRVGGTGPAEVQMWLEEEGREALKGDELFNRFFVEV